tara:strand:- start:196 stop:417 length:222 start_codon:yes stop_codon:yes gene_type:complete
MPKRTISEIRKAILKVLSDSKEHSYGEIERKVNTNWQTVRMHCAELFLFEALTISEDNTVKITKRGLKLLKKI